ncbi:uncharacterized protein LOC116257647 [Nymphaea colorata]|nr:uncharacterized protein LOC116257647 [Nymphaea colorata]
MNRFSKPVQRFRVKIFLWLSSLSSNLNFESPAVTVLSPLALVFSIPRPLLFPSSIDERLPLFRCSAKSQTDRCWLAACRRRLLLPLAPTPRPTLAAGCCCLTSQLAACSLLDSYSRLHASRQSLRPSAAIILGGGAGSLELAFTHLPEEEQSLRTTVNRDVTNLYEVEKKKLNEYFKRVPSVALTTDMWTSNQQIGYISITAHFIDHSWTLQKRIIGFSQVEPPHTGKNLANGRSILQQTYFSYKFGGFKNYYKKESKDKVEFNRLCLSKTFCQIEEKEKHMTLVRSTMQGLYNSYTAKIDGLNKDVESDATTFMRGIDSSCSNSNRSSIRFFSFLNKADNVHFQASKSELDIYLEDGLLKCDVKAHDSFDILIWWKDKELKYPILSHMARDILCIPITTVASESAFSTGCRIVDKSRSSLSPKTVEELVCAGDWIKQFGDPMNLVPVLLKGTAEDEIA